jgi:23S rRNA (uracil1939-C5)-methyltransferase
LLLTIEKLIYGGNGLARLAANDQGRGKAVFVPFVLAGEQIDASIVEQKPGFARAVANKIIEPSQHRVAAECRYFQQCGGCHYQHASYEQQLEIKKEILLETLRRTAKLELSREIKVHPSRPWNYRNRSRLQVQTQPEFALGYFRMGSRKLLAVEECPISSPLINRGIAALWSRGRTGKVPARIREVEFFANADDTQLLIELACDPEVRRADVREWAEELHAEVKAIAGVVGFREGSQHPVEKFVSVGAEFLTYQTERSAYRVSAGSFFQTNRFLTDQLVKIIADGQSGELALDLYAGVGLFSTALAGDFRHIVSVESSQTSSGDLAYNRSSNGQAVQSTAEQYLTSRNPAGGSAPRGENSARTAKGGNPPRIADLVVVDPPRSGLGERVARQLGNLGAPRVVYVSCDPATLARDLVILLGAGYRVEQVHLVDLFPQTFHVECVVHLAR